MKSSAMAMRGRIGGYRTAATHDPQLLTKAARDAFRSKFELEVDPNLELPPQERARRAEAARRAHYAKLAYLSAMARARRKAAAK